MQHMLGYECFLKLEGHVLIQKGKPFICTSVFSKRPGGTPAVTTTQLWPLLCATAKRIAVPIFPCISSSLLVGQKRCHKDHED
jgi:hypothetical protein